MNELAEILSIIDAGNRGYYITNDGKEKPIYINNERK